MKNYIGQTLESSIPHPLLVIQLEHYASQGFTKCILPTQACFKHHGFEFALFLTDDEFKDRKRHQYLMITEFVKDFVSFEEYLERDHDSLFVNVEDLIQAFTLQF